MTRARGNGLPTRNTLACTKPRDREALMSRIRSSLYFAAHAGANFGFDQDTSKLMILVSFMVQKFARWTRGEDEPRH
jgi:hypothetical protein